jgi:hypothetical protein
MSEWGRDQRFKYDGEGRQIGYTDGYAELLRQQAAESARLEASRGGSAGPVICVGLLALGWAIQQLRARFPLWQLFLLVLGIAAVSSWVVRRQLRRIGEWSDRAISVIGTLVFLAISILLGAMFYDLDGLGVKVLILLIAVFVLCMLLGLAIHVFSAVARHPIRSLFITIVGGWLIWVIFIQKPEHTATTAPARPSGPTSVRKNDASKRRGKITHQHEARSVSAAPPELHGGDAGAGQPAGTAVTDESKHVPPGHSLPEPAAKNQEPR